ncbi:MAG: hypothetical protein JRG93_05020 [Deltaproteobacteria bacterium]|nr:hypothetical protein [Deltaproteobacteria bacterium]
MTLDERHRRILFAVVTEYIASGQAVSSRRIAKRYAIKLSPATVRSVLVELEDSELLRQPHTSAGRVPTDAGFRCFVDAMASGGDISNAHRTALIQRLQDLEPGADAVRETGQLLSRLTGTATIIARPPVAEAILDQLRFMRLSSGRTLAVLVARSGGVENRVVVTELDVDGHILERVNNYLADLVGGRTLRSVRDVLAVRIANGPGSSSKGRARSSTARNSGMPRRSEAISTPSKRNRSFWNSSSKPCSPMGSRSSSAPRRRSTGWVISALFRVHTAGTAPAWARSESWVRLAWTTGSTYLWWDSRPMC